MRYGYSTLMCRMLPPEEAAALAQGAGLTAIELRTDDGGRIAGLGREDASRLREAFHALRITDIASSCNLTHEDREALACGKDAVLLAEQIGCGAVRVFADAADRRHPAADPGAVACLRELCGFAADHSVSVWLETHSAFSAAAAILPLLERTDHPGLFVLWDVIHSVECGEEPGETVRLLGDRIAHVHLKDGVPSGEGKQWRLCALGAGELPLGRALGALKETGFDGCLSLEWESAWRPELDQLYPDRPALLRAFRAWLGRTE